MQTNNFLKLLNLRQITWWSVRFHKFKYHIKTHKTKGAIILFMEQVAYVDFYTKENQSLGIV